MSASDPKRMVKVEIKCLRHLEPKWREFCPEPMMAADAERLIEYHKRIDLIPPVGHYSYRIAELTATKEE